MGTHPIFESDFDCLTEMSRELFKQRDAFLSKAAAVPVVENSNRPPAKKPRLSTAPSKKSTAAKNQTNFALLAKIVTHMKQKHLQGDSYPLTLGEILDECSSTNPTIWRGSGWARRCG